MKKLSVLIIISLSCILIITFPRSLAYSANRQVLYKVTKVIDGDTIQVKIGARKEKVRLLGIDAPETKNTSKSVQCFGKEAFKKMKKLVLGKKVRLEADSTNSDRDKYNRLLRYLYLKDGTFVNANLVKNGYAFAYFKFPFQFKAEFQQYQTKAREARKGLWNSDNCPQEKLPATTNNTSICAIKGNINSSGDKIYHMPNGSYYNQTTIDESAGEKWFCSEEEAVADGWRKSQH